ncbi:hypothetical protein [Pelomonas cellulosilytica]|uniref:Uncharacterized protein n=1 Tax=Pelomonas cellulosilytica TaxID=2906762 RepID=A0ABS8Y5X5_9BURK|nr:hypothetical protein [Pelomonas sp. P8]MCE4557985.1 hypothetical protein [Pelomonas sp. P8]
MTDPKASFARPEAEARASGFGLDLSRQLWTYPTQPAHALLLAAAARGTQHQLAIAITDAYFLDARNIADVDVLADVAVNHGFDRQAPPPSRWIPRCTTRSQRKSPDLPLRASVRFLTSISVRERPSAAAAAKLRWRRPFAKRRIDAATFCMPPLRLHEPGLQIDPKPSSPT